MRPGGRRAARREGPPVPRPRPPRASDVGVRPRGARGARPAGRKAGRRGRAQAALAARIAAPQATGFPGRRRQRGAALRYFTTRHPAPAADSRPTRAPRSGPPDAAAWTARGRFPTLPHHQSHAQSHTHHDSTPGEARGPRSRHSPPRVAAGDATGGMVVSMRRPEPDPMQAGERAAGGVGRGSGEGRRGHNSFLLSTSLASTPAPRTLPQTPPPHTLQLLFRLAHPPLGRRHGRRTRRARRRASRSPACRR